MASRTPPSDALAAWIAGRRWFATKTRRIASVVVDDALPLGGGVLALARVTLDDGTEDRYALPLSPPAAGEVADALDDPAFCRALLDLVGRGGAVEGERGERAGRVGVEAPADPLVAERAHVRRDRPDARAERGVEPLARPVVVPEHAGGAVVH
ncbi:MAG: maltokinase N-terminal cap-like domain-containing protein, partial [Candidatus Rokuibacteriota bacterium]